MLIGLMVLIAATFALPGFLVPAARAASTCGCMDVALVIDNTGSMGGAINNVKAELPNIVAAAQAASGGDLRMGLVTFPEDNIIVNQPLIDDIVISAGFNPLSFDNAAGNFFIGDIQVQNGNGPANPRE